MRTIKLYEQDVMCRRFDAAVLSCAPEGGDRWQVVLDRTAFYPEGGGQGGDQGTLGEARVLDTHEKDGEIRHLTDAPLVPGSRVTGVIDWERRWDMMQQHTGEHILSGTIHRLYGPDNVGFHIGSDAVTLDFNMALTEEQLRRAEWLANEVVWADVPVRAWIPSPEELSGIEYRSKKAIDGDVRIVDIPGADTCACCGTHVHTAGQVGQIKLLHWMRYKGGVRLFILCGARALREENALLAQNQAVSQALSVKQGETGEAVSRLLQERDALKRRCDELGTQLFRRMAKAESENALRLVACEALPGSWLRKAAAELAEGADAALVLIPRGEGWSFALCTEKGDCRETARTLTSRFGGKGGGTAQMVQGVLDTGTPEEIRAGMAACQPSVSISRP